MKFTDFHNSELAEASKTRNPTRDFLRNNPVSPDEMAKPVKQMSVPELATISDEALDNAYHYGRSTPGNTFGWQANLKSAAFAKQMIDKGVTDIEQISDAIHKGWNVTARAFVQNPDQFDDTEKLKAAGKLEAKLQQRAKLMNIEYAQLPDDEQEKDRVVARALLQAIKGQPGMAEEVEQMFHVTAEHHGSNKDVPLYTKTYSVRANSEQEAIDTIRKIFGGRNHRITQGVAEGFDDLRTSAKELARQKAERETYKKDQESKEKVAAKNLKNYQSGNVRANYVKEQGVAEGGFDNASPMTKDTVKADRIRSLKNLIAIAKEQERQLRVQELELELKKLQGVAETRIETIHGSAYTIDPNKYYVWAWDNAVVLYGEYTDENDAELNLSKIERRATKRLGPAVKGRFEVASGKMLLRQYGNEQDVAETKADPLGAWIAHKNGTEARKFKTREGAKKYVASHAGFTVSSSEAFHDTYRKKKVQEVKKFRTTYGWAGGSKEPRSAHAKQVATKRKEYEKGLGKFEPTDNMVGTAKIVRDIAMSDASPEHKKTAIDALNKKGVAEEYNPEYDDEAGMADNNLSTLRRAVDGLDDLIDTGDNLPEWCQEKIAVAKSMLVNVWDYMESEEQGVTEGEKWIQKAVNPKTKGNLHKALHVPQDETIPKSRIAQAIHSADPHLRHMAQFAKNVAKEDAGGMGTGSVATSMGAGNGFANGGPGTITRRRK